MLSHKNSCPHARLDRGMVCATGDPATFLTIIIPRHQPSNCYQRYNEINWYMPLNRSGSPCFKYPDFAATHLCYHDVILIGLL